MATLVRPRPPAPNAPPVEWERFERQCDAVELFKMRDEERELDAQIAALPFGRVGDGRWHLLGELDLVVTRRNELEGRLRPWL